MNRPDNRTLSLSYDRAGRLTGIRVTDTWGTPESISYEYDKAGRLIRALNSHSTVAVAYNAINQVTQEMQNDIAIDYLSDMSGRPLLRQTPWHGSIQFDYSGLEHLTSLTFLDGKTIEFDRNSLGLPITTRFPNRTVLTTEFDPAGRILSQKQGINGTILMERYYRYNAGGLLSERVTPSDRTRFLYDPANRLTGVADQFQTPIATFAHDPAGNIARMNANQADHGPGNSLTRFGNIAFTLDPCGNRISKTDDTGITHYRHSMLDQLLSVVCPDGTNCTYEYDALGRRTLKHNRTTDTRTRFYWEGYRLLAETTDDSVTEYLFQPNTFVPLAFIQDSKSYYYSTDHLGTPYEVLDQAGNSVWSASYTAHGLCRVFEASEISNNLRFQGQHFYEESGLHYNLFRYYDPAAISLYPTP